MRMFRSVWPKDQDCTLHDHVFHNFFHGISRVVILASGDKWVLFCYGGLWIRQTPQTIMRISQVLHLIFVTQN